MSGKSVSHARSGIGLLLCLAFIIGITAPAGNLKAQDWKKSYITNLQRLDFRFLGYPDVNEIPVNSSAITSLLTAASGIVYGATTGDTAYLFLFEPGTNKVRHLGKVGDEQAVHHALAEDSQGNIYLGTGLNPFSDLEFSGRHLGDKSIEETIWKDVKAPFAGYEGGHLFRYNPAKSNERVKLPGMQSELEDLGIPLAGNSVYALTSSPDKQTLYGLTYPDGHFFAYDIAGGTFSDKGPVDSKLMFHGPERHWRSLPRALICTKDGRVYTSGTDGYLVFYDPATDRIERTGYMLPGDRFPGEDATYAVAEYFTAGHDGKIYGGASDGHLFSFSTRGDPHLKNLGKARSARRLRCLTTGDDGRIYLIAGERTSTRHCMMFAWDPRDPGYKELGMVIVDNSPHYYWRGYQFDAMATGLDGTIYMGESERKSHLFLYIP